MVEKTCQIRQSTIHMLLEDIRKASLSWYRGRKRHRRKVASQFGDKRVRRSYLPPSSLGGSVRQMCKVRRHCWPNSDCESFWCLDIGLGRTRPPLKSLDWGEIEQLVKPFWQQGKPGPERPGSHGCTKGLHHHLLIWWHAPPVPRFWWSRWGAEADQENIYPKGSPPEKKCFLSGIARKGGGGPLPKFFYLFFHHVFPYILTSISCYLILFGHF